MKHACLVLVLACLLALGAGARAGAAPATPTPAATPPIPAGPPLRLSGRKLESCTPLPGTALPLCRGAPLPRKIGKVASSAPASFDAIQAPELLVVDADRRGWLCLLDGDRVRCAPVAAPVPQNVDIRFWDMPDDYHVVTYTHTPGTPVVLDPGGHVTNAFQVALEAAAVKVRDYLDAGGAHSARPAGGAHASNCDASVEQADACNMEEEPDPWQNGAGDGADGWDNGPGPGTDPRFDPNDGWDNGPGPGTGPEPGEGWGSDPWPDLPPMPDMPPWTDPGCDIGPCPGFGDDIPPMIPPLPRDPDMDTADLTPCDALIPGIISICIRAQRPPPPVDEAPLPSGPRPWFPQSWCDFASLFCSNGQIQKSAESGKTLSELVADCRFTVRVKFDLCKIDDAMEADMQRYAACLQVAKDEYETCLTRARDLTDNGAHPAP